MTYPSLPSGRYLTAFNQVRTVAGGQTHALLHRTWLFAEECGVPSTILTFDPFPDYAGVEAQLRERGQLHPDVELRNIYDDLRDRSQGHQDLDGRELASLGHLTAVPEHRPDGTLWRTRYDDPNNLQPVSYDYHRQDGTPYLRTAPLSMDDFRSREDLVQVVSPTGRVQRSFPSVGAWWADWFAGLVESDPEVFLLYDSMMIPPHLAPLVPSRVHQVATMHMSHVYHPRRWNSPQHPPARRSLEQLSHFAAFVILTERQRADVELAYGRRSNLVVLPNPGRPVEPPSPLPRRDPQVLVVIARLERVKRVDDAIRAFAEVVRRVPEARLDVYGDGRQRAQCQALVDELGLGASVRLLGHCPDARDRLWEASGVLVTSRSEGFPLVTLEALARGCPVVSYDIKYGPREQVEHGVTGLLAPPGDVAALADHCVRLLTSPDLVRSMGVAGREHVRHDHDLYTSRWAQILHACVDAAPRRTRLERVALAVHGLGWADPRWRRLTGTREVAFRGTLEVEAGPTLASLADAHLDLEAVDDASGAVVSLPLDVGGPLGGAFTLASTFDLSDVVRRAADQGASGRVALRLRLRFTWEQSYWETDLSRAPGDAPVPELAFLDDGAIRLRADVDPQGRARRLIRRTLERYRSLAAARRR